MGICPYFLLFVSSCKFPIMSVIQHTGLLGHDMVTTKAKTLNHILILLREVVKSSSPEVFKKCIDVALGDMV